MAKIDKSQYTKEEWKIIREKRRQEKAKKNQIKEQQEKAKQINALEKERNKKRKEQEKLSKENKPVQDNVQTTQNVQSNVQNYVLCLKHGNKYSAEYVNNLYSMVKRNLSIDYKFVCLTENPQDLHKDILVLPLPSYLEGWWCKPYIYSADLPLDGTILYMDLDVVISGSLDKLFTYRKGEWCVIRDFTRSMQPNWEKYNSSVIRFGKGQLNHVWTGFNKDPKKVIGSHFGDQDWLWTAAKGTAALWPDSWIQSYKWEIRKDRQLTAGIKGQRKFLNRENAVPGPDCCIAVFHGDPNPHNCDDSWVKQNWK